MEATIFDGLLQAIYNSWQLLLSGDITNFVIGALTLLLGFLVMIARWLWKLITIVASRRLITLLTH